MEGMARREEEEERGKSADLFMAVAEDQNWLIGKPPRGTLGTQESFWCRNPASWCAYAQPTIDIHPTRKSTPEM